MPIIIIGPDGSESIERGTTINEVNETNDNGELGEDSRTELEISVPDGHLIEQERKDRGVLISQIIKQ